MKPFFASKKDIESLQARLLAWLGTPFMAHGCIKGVGCSCETFVLSVYKEEGFLPRDFSIPEGTIRHFRTATGAGLMEPFIDGCEHFEGLRAMLPDVQPGDMLGYRVGRIVHHLGIVYSKTEFAHCVDPAGVKFSSLRDATYLRRWARLWRPVTA